MRAIPANVWQHMEKLIDAGVFVWAYVIQVNGIAGGQAYYLVANSEPITIGGVEYQPWPVSHDRVEDNADGDLTEIVLTLSNVGRQAARQLENDQWDQSLVTMLLIYTPAPDNETGIRFTSAVHRATVTEEFVQLNLAAHQAMNRPIPPERFDRDLGYLGIPR